MAILRDFSSDFLFPLLTWLQVFSEISSSELKVIWTDEGSDFNGFSHSLDWKCILKMAQLN